MKKIDLEQGSQEWLDFRRTKIGGSDAPIIMDVSPYKTAEDLFFQKVNGFSDDFVHEGMLRGHQLEPIVRELYSEKVAASLHPAVVVSDEHDWMMASLDGLADEFFIEIKCPNQIDHDIAVSGKIPPKYYPQVQHCLAVTGFKFAYYVSYRDEETAEVYVPRDEEYIAKLIEIEREFYTGLCMEVLPERFRKTVERPDIDKLFLDYLRIKESIKIAEIELEMAKKALLQCAADKDIQTDLVSIKKVTRTSYDYERLFKEHPIDREPYKKMSTYFDIRERK